MRRALVDMRPGPLRGPHRARRALPAGPDGQHPDLLRAQARPRAARLPPPDARADPRDDLRRHRLPGAGDADRARCSPATRSARPTCCAAPWARRSRPRWTAQRERFVDGAVERGIDIGHGRRDLRRCCAQFADYGFNKCHAAAYALVAYQTAYMKANYPVEFLAASMTLDMRQHRQARRIPRARRMRLGIKVEPPSVNRSGVEFEVEAGTHPLCARRDQGRRRAGGRGDRRVARDDRPFRDLADFAGRINPRARQQARAGKPRRRRRVRRTGAQTARACMPASTASSAGAAAPRGRRRSGRASCSAALATREPLPLPAVEPWLPAERLQKRVRGGRLLPLRPSARRLCGGAASACACSPGPSSPSAVKAGATAGRLAGTVVSRAGAPHQDRQQDGHRGSSPIRPATTRRCCSPKGCSSIATCWSRARRCCCS